MHKQVADHAHLFSALRLVGYTRFRLPAWNEAVRRLRPEASDHETVTMLKTLFNYAVVGVPRVGGRGVAVHLSLFTTTDFLNRHLMVRW
jgi:hypothetical protein